jgi:hypothetical protein
MSDGLSIRPQTLHLSPRYRRLRDAILRPHLRLTESRYFWERWKPRLGADAAVLIMEVRDRCNRALAHPTAFPSLPGVDRQTDSNMSDMLNTSRGTGGPEGEGEGEGMGMGMGMGAGAGAGAGAEAGMAGAEGCTVSANELAAACGFSRVTLWRILQREDVRRFIVVEHNYVYDRRLGKKRRTVSTYHVQMEDPLVEEDEARLRALLAAQGEAGGGSPPGYPPPGFQSETQVVGGRRPRLQSATAKSGSTPKPQNVPETNLNQRLGANDGTAGRGPTQSTGVGEGIARAAGVGEGIARATGVGEGIARAAGVEGGRTGRPVEVDIWRRYPELAHHVEEAEQQLGDAHSRGFYLKALKQLYPGHMDLWRRALGLAREQQNIRRSRGALFTRLLRTFAAEAGVSL